MCQELNKHFVNKIDKNSSSSSSSENEEFTLIGFKIVVLGKCPLTDMDNSVTFTQAPFFKSKQLLQKQESLFIN